MAAERVIRLDPGLAFGTGTHPTTRMCLRWIASHAAAWPRVLDYGCGSGSSPSRRRCTARSTSTRWTSIRRPSRRRAPTRRPTAWPSATALPDVARGEYALVLANILAKPLKLLAPLLWSHLAPGGALVLAGILERQADELIDAYAPWCALEVSDREDGWILMTARRPAATGMA